MKKKKVKIKKQGILEPNNKPPNQIAEVVWIEKEKKKNCNNCAYYRRPSDIEPCSSCDQYSFSNWKKQPKISRNPGIRR